MRILLLFATAALVVSLAPQGLAEHTSETPLPVLAATLVHDCEGHVPCMPAVIQFVAAGTTPGCGVYTTGLSQGEGCWTRSDAIALVFRGDTLNAYGEVSTNAATVDACEDDEANAMTAMQAASFLVQHYSDDIYTPDLAPYEGAVVIAGSC